MIPLQPFLLILIATLGGWAMAWLFLQFLFFPNPSISLLGFKVRGMVPALQPGLSKDLSLTLQQYITDNNIISDQLISPQMMTALRPEMEAHIDRFMTDKLPEAFPLLSKYMGEKTIGKFKAAFLLEVESILPVFMNSLSAKMMQGEKPAAFIEENLSRVSIVTIKNIFYKQASAQIMLFKATGALAGLTIGLVQWLAIYLVQTNT